jgi:preprotein translocase subunit SecA
VSGVTGTLSTLGEDEKRVIRSDYSISNFYCMPSAYGGSKLKDDGITVTGSDVHYQQIVSQIEGNIQGRAVLIFFENFQLLEKFWQSEELKACLEKVHVNLKDVNLLVEETPPANKQQIVSSRATAANALTLATKPFGRGTDFVSMDARVNDSGGIHVVQTFLSESESEEVQIRGRTARQGDSGSYSLLLESDSLTREYQVPAEEIDRLMQLPATPRDAKAALLQAHRSRLFAGKFDTMKAFVEANLSEDTNAWAFVEDLVSGKKKDVQAQLEKFNVPVRTTRILIVMDATGSMQGMMDQLKANLRTMVTRAKEFINDKMKESPSAHFEMQVTGKALTL